jgi:hypothetical protein
MALFQWSNFEIGNLNWLRSEPYLDYFNTLDQDGGFFYERWGDAPVHSIAAALLLPKEQIHFFNEIGYYHVPFTHCPTGEKQRLELKCHCNPSDNFDWKGYSCKFLSNPNYMKPVASKPSLQNIRHFEIFPRQQLRETRRLRIGTRLTDRLFESGYPQRFTCDLNSWGSLYETSSTAASATQLV